MNVVAKRLALALILAVATASVAAAVFDGAYAGRVLPGVSVAGVDLAGMSPDEARARLAAIAVGPATLTVVVGSRTVSVPAEVLGRFVDVDGAVEAAALAGRGRGPLGDLGERWLLVTDRRDLPLRVSVDQAKLDAWLASAAAMVRRGPVDATVVATPDGWAATPGRLGATLDEAAATVLLRDALTGARQVAGPIALPLRPLAPVVDDLDAAVAIGSATRMTGDMRVALGDKSWRLPSSALRSAIRYVVVDGKLTPIVDPAAIEAALGPIAKKVGEPARQTLFLVPKRGGTFGYVQGAAGRALDRAATAALIIERLAERRDVGAADSAPVEAATTAVQPKISAEEAAKIAPRMTRISGWTVRFVVSEKNGFGNNIIIPARIINGTVVRPGEVFDFWRAVGPITPSRGFRMGGIIQGGRTIPTGAIGGGICSASTTLFNAAVRGGYQILERHAHYYYIPRYPLGLDATVSKSGGRSSENMRFRNDTPYPLYIRGLAGSGWVRFEIYSLPTGRSVSFTRPSVSNVRPAVDRVVRTAKLRRGTTDRQEYPANGMNTVVSRVVRDARGTVIHRDTWVSHYGRVDGILLVGIS